MPENKVIFNREPLEVIDGIPVFSQDRYWGKVPEKELKACINLIDENGFEAFDHKLQKKFDFTYDEDRADWRFFIPLNKDATIIDIGSGLGRITIPLARIAGKVFSCDHSLSRMRFLKRRSQAEKLSNIEVFVGDIFDIPLPSQSVDLIVLNGVLEWVGLTDLYADPREAQIAALKKCYELLKPGGYLYIGIENRIAMAYLKAPDHGGLRYTSFMPRKIAHYYARRRGQKGYRTYTYTKRGYQKLLEKCGFLSNKFYLLFPGYNLPRIIINYDDIHLLKFLISTFKSPKQKIRKIAFKIFSLPLMARIYRAVFYSFGIISQKPL